MMASGAKIDPAWLDDEIGMALDESNPSPCVTESGDRVLSRHVRTFMRDRLEQLQRKEAAFEWLCEHAFPMASNTDGSIGGLRIDGFWHYGANALDAVESAMKAEEGK